MATNRKNTRQKNTGQGLSAYVPVRMPPALKERLEALADAQDRSTSRQALRFIEQGLRRTSEQRAA